MKKYAFVIFLSFFSLTCWAQQNDTVRIVLTQEEAVEMSQFLTDLLDSTHVYAIQGEEGALNVSSGKIVLRFVNYEIVCTVSRNNITIHEQSFRTTASGSRGELILSTLVEYSFSGEPKVGTFICTLKSLSGIEKRASLAKNLLVTYRQQLLTTVRAYKGAPKKIRNGTYLVPIK